MSSLVNSNNPLPIVWIFHFLGRYIYQEVSFKLDNEEYSRKILQKSPGKIDLVISKMEIIRIWIFLNLNPFKKVFSR